MIHAVALPSRPEGRLGPDEHLERAVAAGHRSFRLPIEWAGAEPTAGRYDETVFERHASVCRKGRARGLEPVVVLHHLGLPGWLGAHFWLRLDAPGRFGDFAAVVVDRLGDDCGRWISLLEPNAVAWRGWITGAVPPYRVAAVGDLVRSLDHMLTAHLAAEAAVHLARPEARVDLDAREMPVYELDGLLHDLLASRARGVARYDLGPWLTERRREWYRTRPRPSIAGAVLRRAARSAIPLEQALARTVATVFAPDGADPGGAYDDGLDSPP